jgi:hypothetical protein
LARCSNAISAGDFVTRQPTVTGIGAQVFKLRRLLANPVEEEEAHTLFHADAAHAGAAIFEDLRDSSVGAFVFFPSANVCAEADQLARAHLLELRHDPRQFAACRDDEPEHALALPPAHASVIKHARPRFEVNGVKAIFAHQALCLLNARAPLVIADGHDLAIERAQLANRIRDILGAGLSRVEESRSGHTSREA